MPLFIPFKNMIFRETFVRGKDWQKLRDQNQIYFKKAFSSLLLTLEVQEERLTVDVLVGHEIVDGAGVDAVPVLGVQAEDDEVTVTQLEVLLVV